MDARALESILSLRGGTLGKTLGQISDRGERVLALGMAELDDVLPQGGLACGSVTELQVRGPSGAATSFALCACRAALSGHTEGQDSWCAFIDPSATLFAPGVAQLGLDLERLLVVRPDVESIGRAAVRIAEANLVSVLVIDLRGVMNDLSVDERLWQRTIRRLTLSVKSTATCVLVLTRAQRSQSLPLPTFMRLEFARTSMEAFEVRVAKERTGRVSAPHSIPWSVFDGPLSRDKRSRDARSRDKPSRDKPSQDKRPGDVRSADAPEVCASDDVWHSGSGAQLRGFSRIRKEDVSRNVS